MTTRQLVAMLVLSFVWGCSFLFIRVLVDSGMEPLGVSAGRTALGLLSLAPFALAMLGKFPRDRRTWLALAALGLFNFAIPWTLFGLGEEHVSSGIGSITNSSMPLWSAIVSTVLIKGDALGRGRTAGLLLGFGGVVVLTGGSLGEIGSGALVGIPLMVLATVLYGVSGVCIRRWLGHVPAVPLTVAQVGFAALYLMPAALLTGAYSHASMGWQEWGSLVALGVGGSGLAVVVYMWLIGQVGPVRASVVTYLMPPIGVFLGWLLLDESVGWPMVAGLAFIVLGVAGIQGRLRPIRLSRWQRGEAPGQP